MTLKEKAKTYNFWISLASAVVLIVRIIGDKFNIFIDTTLIMDVTTGLCSIFVILGILSAPKIKTIETNKTEHKNSSQQNTQNEQSENLNTTQTTTSINVENDIICNETNQDYSKNDTYKTEENNLSEVIENVSETKNITTPSSTISLRVMVESLKSNIEQANSVVNQITKNI